MTASQHGASNTTSALFPSIGLALFWTWTLLTYYSLCLFPQSEQVSSYAYLIWIATSWAQAAAFIAIAAASRQIKTIIGRPILIIASFLLATLGTTLLPLGLSINFSLPSVSLTTGIAGYVLTGCTGACIVISWSEILCFTSSDYAFEAMNASLVFSALFFFIISSLPYPLIVFVASLLPLASGIILARQAKAAGNTMLLAHERPSPPTLRKQGQWKICIPLAIPFFCALCGEILRNLLVVGSDSSEGFSTMGAIYVFGGAIGIAILMLIVRRFPKTTPQESPALRLALSIMILGYLLTTVFEAPLTLGYMFFAATFSCIRALSWWYSAQIVEHNGFSPLAAFGISLSAFSVPIALSVPLIVVLTAGVLDSSIPWVSIVVVIIALFFFISIFALNQNSPQSNRLRQNETSHSAITTEQTEDALEKSLKDRFGLTSRETEIAILLYRGRSVPFIQQTLHIAEGTANTHMRHIYQKMSVHNRQEFITVIDQLSCKNGTGHA